MVVLQKLCREVFSTCAYLAILSLAELLLLYTRCGNFWLKELIGKDLSENLMLYSQSICKVYPFAYNFLFHMSKWLLVATAAEGFIATRCPQRALSMCTLSKAKAVVILLTVLLVCINVHFFWTFELLTEKGHIMCTFSKYHGQLSEEFITDVWPVTDFLVAEVLPLCAIAATGTSMLVLTARGRHCGSASHQEWRSRYTLNPRTLDNLKRTFVVLCILYVTLSLPNVIFNICRHLFRARFDSNDLSVIAKVSLAETIISMLQYTFLSTKFLVYMICCPKFRSEVVQLFRCKCSKTHPPSAVSRPLMKKPSSSSTLNGASSASGAKWSRTEITELDSPSIVRVESNI